MLRRALLPALGWLSLTCAAAAQTLNFPPLSGRVVDEAGILDASTRDGLTQTLADLEQKTTDQLVVVTLRSLQGTSIEDYGYQLGRAWQIGQKDKNNGVLLIVAPNERKVRIEVGYGLEGELTDAVSKLIIENSILPRFKVSDYAGGIKRGVEDIVQVLSGDAQEWQDRAAERVSLDDAVSPDQAVWPLIMVVLGGVAFLLFCAIWGGFVCRAILQYVIFVMLSSGRDSSRQGSFGGGGSFSGGGGSFGGGGASGSW
ncbi:MAG TPA: YgcG family protein [Bradyrhizobium sp.]|nr:YgcG family protein [Bradyrhizobium sp.]